MGHDVFVSHSSKDKTLADAVVAALERHGIKCWVAPRDLLPGSSWANSILKAIESSRLIVLVFSGNANASPHVRREVERAVNFQIPVAPVRVQSVLPTEDLEFFLSASHWMDAITPPFDQHLAKLAEQIRALLAMGPEGAPSPGANSPPLATSPTPPTPPPAPAPRKTRVRSLVLAAVILLVAGAAVAVAVVSTRGGFTRLLSSTGAAGPPAAADARFFTNSLAMKFAHIAPGEFQMGSPETEAGRHDNETQHAVRITRPFLLGVHHVTRGQFATFIGDSGYKTDAEKKGKAFSWNYGKPGNIDGASWRSPGFDQGDDHPAVDISWNDATAFCLWLSGKEGKRYRLPTEAEWEYSCRAGTTTAFPWGDDPNGGNGWANVGDLELRQKLNTDLLESKQAPAGEWTGFKFDDGFAFTSPVGIFKANAFGLYDMIGNVWQWCSDGYGDYPAGPADDPSGLQTAASRVQRGGSWFAIPAVCRCAFRGSDAPASPYGTVGFRVALDF